ncbi:MAG: thioredoxin family protein [Crocinitomicaceae bacterium]|nr:thioredoxin family protein [Crocinitomicaceae bacterium]
MKYKTAAVSAFILLLSTVSSVLFAQNTEPPADHVQWLTVEQAVAAQAVEPRKIMIDVYTQWCGPCRLMTQKTFGDKDVIDYLNKNFYSVKFDAESPDSLLFKGVTYKNPDYVKNKPGRNGVHHFARYLNVSAYPTLVFMDEEGGYISPVVGYKTPAQLELFLKLFASNSYKTITTQEQWQEYQSKFTPAWKNE